MKMLTQEQIMKVKGQGFLQNRGTELFSGRIAAPGTVFTAENFSDMAELSKRFGNGKLICTSRQGVEIPGIPFDKIEAAQAFAAERGLRFGGTGAKVRPITACKGTTCVFGNCDTQAIAKEIYEKFYIGWTNVKLPHKFKIAVGGCPNSCIKPSLNDLGIEAHRVPVFSEDICRGCASCAIEKKCPSKAASVRGGKLYIDSGLCKNCGVCIGKCPFGAIENESETVYKIYVGGTWGKTTRMGSELSRYVKEAELMSVVERVILWYRENALPKERLGKTVDRLGIAAVENAVFSDELMSRKQEILSKEI